MMNHSPLLPAQQRLAGGAITLDSYNNNTWELPACYAAPESRGTAALREYGLVTTSGGVGIFDGSACGILQLRGRDRHAFLHGMVSNDILRLRPGQSCRAAMLDSTGHVLADMYVYALDEVLLLQTDPRCLDCLAATLEKYLIMEKVGITDVSDQWAVLSLLGEGSLASLASLSLSAIPAELTPHQHLSITTHAGESGILAASGRFSIPVYDLWLPPSAGVAAWEQLIALGAQPVGRDAEEILRVEAADPAWGSELNGSVLLPEAELAEAVSYTKGCYVGQEIVARIQARGHTNRALRSIVFSDSSFLPAPGDLLWDVHDPQREIGRVTSCVASPRHDGKPLALGYIRKEFLEPGTEIVCRSAAGAEVRGYVGEKRHGR